MRPQTSDPALAEQLEFNPFLPEVHDDPYPMYRRLRELDPVHWNPMGVWVVSRHADFVRLVRDPRMSSDFRNSDLYRLFTSSMPPEYIDTREPSLLFRDPPDHTRLRALVSKAFTARAIDDLRPFISSVLEDLLGALRPRETFDLVADVARPLPVIVICRMLGVPAADMPLFVEWSDALVHTLDPLVGPEVFERAAAAEAGFEAYFRERIDERRRDARDDLLSALIAAEDDGEHLSEEELLRTLVLLLVAGHETTVNLISSGMLALLRDPDEARRLREDPSLDRTAVEELLRYDSPVQFASRVPTQDVEVRDKRIAAGQQIVGLIGSANRDPLAFDDPDRLDVGRTDNRHVAFSGGIHFCLGASLARAEGQAAIGALVRTFPDMELAVERPERRETITLRGLRSLPVAV